MFTFNSRAVGALFALSTLIAPVAFNAAHAADPYPNKPVKVIVNSSPGGLTDVVARLVVNRMAQGLGKPFVVENRSGAAVVGIDAVAKSAPDGYTLGIFANSVSVLPAILPNPPLNVDKDLAPVALLNITPMVLITATSSPYKTLPQYIAAAKAKPAEISFASGGNATMGHMLAEQLQASAGVSLIHVPYKGGAPAMTDILGGQVAVFFDTMGTTAPMVKDGKVRPLAIAAKERSTALPDVPTLAELGYGDVQGSGWFGMFVPSGTPKEIVDRLNAEVNVALQSPEVRDRLVELGSIAEGGPPKALADLMATEIPRWSKLVRDRNIKAN